jgi:FKBP-type peptidyl-prolyl cis-trans isomerase FkpA
VIELQTIELNAGTGAEAVSGKAVVVHYTGWLYDPATADGHGAKFDSSLDRKVPFGFFLGSGKVIKGWDEGIVGMKVGGKRTLVIPPHKAYGERGAGGVIPPNATLLFDVELIEVKG